MEIWNVSVQACRTERGCRLARDREKGTKGKKEHEAKTTTPEFSAARHWGSLSPVYSVDSGVYGLEGASAKVPDGCSVVQAHIYVSFIWYLELLKVALV